MFSEASFALDQSPGRGKEGRGEEGRGGEALTMIYPMVPTGPGLTPSHQPCTLRLQWRGHKMEAAPGEEGLPLVGVTGGKGKEAPLRGQQLWMTLPRLLGPQLTLLLLYSIWISYGLFLS